MAQIGSGRTSEVLGKATCWPGQTNRDAKGKAALRLSLLSQQIYDFGYIWVEGFEQILGSEHVKPPLGRLRGCSNSLMVKWIRGPNLAFKLRTVDDEGKLSGSRMRANASPRGKELVVFVGGQGFAATAAAFRAKRLSQKQQVGYSFCGAGRRLVSSGEDICPGAAGTAPMTF